MKEYNQKFAKFAAASIVGIGGLFLVFELVANSEPKTEETAAVVATAEVAQPASGTNTTSTLPVNTQTDPVVETPVEEPVTDTSSSTAATTTNSVAEPVEETPAEPTPATQTISSSVNYSAPEGHKNAITVAATIEGTTVTAVSSTHVGTGESAAYQKAFDRLYQDQVVGKDINSISLSRVGGASLTTGAFNLALDDIIDQL